MPEDEEVQIGFRGPRPYREMVQRAALDRGMKVQGLLEEAVRQYLAGVQSDAKPKDSTKQLPELGTSGTKSRDNLSSNGVVLRSGELVWIQRMLRALRSREQSPVVAQVVENVLLLSESVLGADERKAGGDAQKGSPEEIALARDAANAVALSRRGLRVSGETKTRTKRVVRDKDGDREKAG